jgi:hypothetical protein
MAKKILFKDPNAIMQIKGQDGVFSNANGRMTEEVYNYLIKLSPDAADQFTIVEEKSDKKSDKNLTPTE